MFTLENLSLISFRERTPEFYDPEFSAPGYPILQILGIVGGLVFIARMGTLSLVGAVGIIVAGAVWYLVYARNRADRRGAFSL